VTNPSAPPGKSTKYARRELERRFLLATVPEGWREVARTTVIVDRYLEGTRLRIRRATEGDRVVYKLTQKIPGEHGSPGLITTMYVSEEEHARLSVIPARVLSKTRLSVPPFGVDVFDFSFSFPLPGAGLVLAEAEFETEEQMRLLSPPAWSVAEVTLDPRFTGGSLASSSRDELAAWLCEFGIA
jgi:CYTH domain-containing protein